MPDLRVRHRVPRLRVAHVPDPLVDGAKLEKLWQVHARRASHELLAGSKRTRRLCREGCAELRRALVRPDLWTVRADAGCGAIVLRLPGR
jgi:hypothetical protein